MNSPHLLIILAPFHIPIFYFDYLPPTAQQKISCLSSITDEFHIVVTFSIFYFAINIYKCEYSIGWFINLKMGKWFHSQKMMRKRIERFVMIFDIPVKSVHMNWQEFLYHVLHCPSLISSLSLCLYIWYRLYCSK
jgi:hypothetical protein